jgi:hypothetical protein
MMITAEPAPPAPPVAAVTATITTTPAQKIKHHNTTQYIPVPLTLLDLASAKKDVRSSSNAIEAPIECATDSHTRHPGELQWVMIQKKGKRRRRKKKRVKRK